MVGFSAFAPIEHLGAVRRLLDEQGFGPSNFNVPLRSGNEAATHAGMHAWPDATFRQAIENLPAELGVTVYDGQHSIPPESFAKMADDASIEWSDPQDPERPWFANPVMTGATRTLGGKTWQSLVDNNVWQPPVNWREVPAAGQRPVWVQPTGAGDAWSLGAEVTHDGKQWKSTIPANVWEPGVRDLWEEIETVDPGPTVQPWRQPTGAQDAYAIGARVTHDRPQDGGATWIFESRIAANTTEPGRDGTFDRWWRPVERA